MRYTKIPLEDDDVALSVVCDPDVDELRLARLMVLYEVKLLPPEVYVVAAGMLVDGYDGGLYKSTYPM